MAINSIDKLQTREEQLVAAWYMGFAAFAKKDTANPFNREVAPHLYHKWNHGYSHAHNGGQIL